MNAYQNQQRGGALLLGMLIGFVLGIIAAACVVWYIKRTPPPLEDKTGHNASVTDKTANADKTPLPGKPGDKPSDKSRFDFYKILPGNQEATPTPAPTVAPPPTTSTPSNDAAKPKIATENIYLQAGAFSKLTDADTLKAKIILLGLDVGVQEADVEGKKVYRVRIGPFTNLDEMNRVRNQLAQSAISANLIK